MDGIRRILQRYFWPFLLIPLVPSALTAYDIIRTLKEAPVEAVPKAPQNIKKIKRKPKALRRPFSRYALIEKRDLFTYPEADGNKPKEEKTQQETPLSPLNIRLRGTVIGFGRDSQALIQDISTRRQDLYRTGEKIQGAEIVEILKDHVILKRGGKEERLLLFEGIEERGERRRSSTIAAGKRRTPAQYPFARRGSSAVRNAPARSRPSGRPLVLKRQEIAEVTSDINRLLTRMRVSPYFENGRPEGFRVSGIKGGSIIEKAGIRNGDVIQMINGVKVNSPTSLIKAYKGLERAKTITIRVKRGNRIQDLLVKVE